MNIFISTLNNTHVYSDLQHFTHLLFFSSWWARVSPLFLRHFFSSAKFFFLFILGAVLHDSKYLLRIDTFELHF